MDKVYLLWDELSADDPQLVGCFATADIAASIGAAGTSVEERVLWDRKPGHETFHVFTWTIKDGETNEVGQTSSTRSELDDAAFGKACEVMKYEARPGYLRLVVRGNDVALCKRALAEERDKYLASYVPPPPPAPTATQFRRIAVISHRTGQVQVTQEEYPVPEHELVYNRATFEKTPTSIVINVLAHDFATAVTALDYYVGLQLGNTRSYS